MKTFYYNGSKYGLFIKILISDMKYNSLIIMYSNVLQQRTKIIIIKNTQHFSISLISLMAIMRTQVATNFLRNKNELDKAQSYVHLCHTSDLSKETVSHKCQLILLSDMKQRHCFNIETYNKAQFNKQMRTYPCCGPPLLMTLR